MRLSVRTKLLGSFLVVVALLVIVSIVGVAKIGSVRSTADTLGDNIIPRSQALLTASNGMNAYMGDVPQYIGVAQRRGDTGRVASELGSDVDAADGGIDAAVKLNAGRADLLARWAALDEAWQAYLRAVEPVRDFADAGSIDEALAVYSSEGAAEATARIDAAVQDIRASQVANAATAVTDAGDTASSARTLLIGLAVVAVVVALLIAMLLSRQISGGVGQMMRAARGIAKGDVEQTVEVKSRDEIGETAEAFREMIAYLEEMAQAARRIAAGDLSVEVLPKSERDALGLAFQEMSADLRAALGDQSSLDALIERMDSLSMRDLADLELALTAVANGDLTVDVAIATRTIDAEEGRDAGRLATIFNGMLGRTQSSISSYNAMRARVAQMLQQIARESQAVAAASQQMATTSDESGRAVNEIASAVGEVAAGAERQVRTVGEARTLTGEVVSATRQSADNAEQTAHAADQARAVAAEGAETIRQATEAMSAVRASSSEVTGTIRQLGSKSEQIGGIVATITGIAEQTNLLALNAAIEAARAGEQGRGFAVVAEEVRKLAEESQQAARSISELIKEIQSETGRAVDVVEDGARQTEHGAQTVEQAGLAFDRIGSSVEDMNGRIAQIAGAVTEIAQRATQMEENMADVASIAEQSSASTEQVSASTQQTSASTQEIAASAQELARTAEELERLVGQFTLA
ncbi:methyl-accepting chemotaxis protein [Conexibacter sp. CPCC 206217]|uniref:HAMP domain-containing methyl-accepting chemotaxis protein n=1 Tax=Conexibacter sp. CPCC 206217 TaxID=3064574 RepID=UPI00271E82DF|nr:methyl-accepting chemotaxis protein [Conexibacter sp. CPCC 206217]MDO8212364.1 methyl-accepting chemotaxis protein [Conexibacter sp. CPCC 206217]